MPQQPGEVSLLTLFADIHYHISPPTAKPSHHRFDRSSYVYLYHDALNRRGRLEVANHPGTQDQDALTGYLDSATIEYSHKHPNLFTITVDGRRGANGAASPSPQQDTSQWHLPAHDLRNETKYMYRLHTLDLYFWTADDASLFLDSLQRVLQDHQLKISDAPAAAAGTPEHRDSMSPVVQKLENAAISNHYKSSTRSNSVSTSQSFSGPPSNMTPVSPPSSPPVELPGSGYAPMAYNPAAPAAPEPIAHREKTPPPPDAESGTGLATVAVSEQGVPNVIPGQYAGGMPQQHQQPYMPGPPQRQPTMPPPPPMNGTPAPGLQRASTSFSGPPPQSQTPSYTQSFAPPPPQQLQDPNAHLYAQQQPTPQPGLQRQNTMPTAFSGPPQQQYMAQSTPPHGQPQNQYANYTPNPVVSPLSSPTTPGLLQQPGQPQQSYNPIPSPSLYNPTQPSVAPVGGYGQHDYQTPQQQQFQPQLQQQQQQSPQQYQQAQQGQDYSVHQQLYRPTEQEWGRKHGEPVPQQAQAGPGQQPGKSEERVQKIEKGVGRFLRKLDKKF
ncbi:hypothetical protein K402DRAFT_451340 [Aulographum hederae CBS 113979]|uniref:RNA recognition motif-containing protein n=1 Tax=Aulographum hederae CBS 113979 TaxID=1176131 RepID=A0A6G1HBE0_9PEZI|nr:hypothetical protein K402DRAFT_451340 [Aulographum hederae CBS 113979]